MTGKEFSAIRKGLELSQELAGEEIGFKRRTVQDWERMDSVPKYAEILINYLFSKTGHGNSQPENEDTITALKENVSLLKSMVDGLKDDKQRLQQKLDECELKLKTNRY